MKGKYIWIALAVSAALFSACEKEQYLAPDKSKYIYDIPQTTLPTDAIVGVFYNNYTSPVSSATSAEVPTLGYYATADEGVLTQHIAWADEAGTFAPAGRRSGSLHRYAGLYLCDGRKSGD